MSEVERLDEPSVHTEAVVDDEALVRQAVAINPEDHLGLLHHTAKIFRRGASGIVQSGQATSWKRAMSDSILCEYNDIIQDAYFGLHRAAEKFDPERGFKFSTYAVTWIGQSITRRAIDSYLPWRVPAHIFDKVRKEGGDLPVPERLEYHSDTYFDEVPDEFDHNGIILSTPEHFGALVPTEDIEDFAAEDSLCSVENEIDGQILLNNLRQLLDEREYKILLLRNGFFGEPLTLEQVGSEFGLTRERVRQIEKKSLNRLREIVDADGTVNHSIPDSVALNEMFERLAAYTKTRPFAVDEERPSSAAPRYEVVDQEKFDIFLQDLQRRTAERLQESSKLPEPSEEELRAEFQEKLADLPGFSISPSRMPQGYTAWFNQVLSAYYSYMKTPEGKGIVGFMSVSGVNSNLMAALNSFCGGILGVRGRKKASLNFELFEFNDEDALSILSIYLKSEEAAEELLRVSHIFEHARSLSEQVPEPRSLEPEVIVNVRGCDNSEVCVLEDGGAEWLMQKDRDRLFSGRVKVNGLTRRALRGGRLVLEGECEKAPNGTCVLERKFRSIS